MIASRTSTVCGNVSHPRPYYIIYALLHAVHVYRYYICSHHNYYYQLLCCIYFTIYVYQRFYYNETAIQHLVTPCMPEGGKYTSTPHDHASARGRAHCYRHSHSIISLTTLRARCERNELYTFKPSRERFTTIVNDAELAILSIYANCCHEHKMFTCHNKQLVITNYNYL